MTGVNFAWTKFIWIKTGVNQRQMVPPLSPVLLKVSSRLSAREFFLAISCPRLTHWGPVLWKATLWQSPFVKSTIQITLNWIELLLCVFRDALQHTTVIMCSYLHYCQLTVHFDQSAPCPLTSLINNVSAELLLTGCCFAHHSLQILETAVLEKPTRPAISEIQIQITLFHPFWHLVWKIVELFLSCQHAFMHLVTSTWSERNT